MTDADYKLPVLATTRRVWAIVFRNLDVLARVAWVPALAMVLASLIQAALVRGPGPGGEGAGISFALLLVQIVIWIALVPAAAAWHRFIVLGDGADARVRYVWERTETRYLATLLVVWVVSNVPFIAAVLVLAPLAAALGGGAPLLATALVLLGLGYLMVLARLALALPAAALGEDASLGRAWRLSAGNAWRLLGVTLATLVPFVLAAGLVLVPVWLMIGGAGEAGDPSGPSALALALAAALDAAISLLALALLLTLFSGCYLNLGRAPRA